MIVEKLHAVLVTVHLGMGLVLFAMVLIVARHVYQLDKIGEASRERIVLLVLLTHRQLNHKSKL